MFANLDVFSTAMSMSRHAGHKQALSAQNIANADTPGYAARTLPDFATAVKNQMTAPRATRDGHLFGTSDSLLNEGVRREAADPNGNTVSLELEMIEAVNAKRQHDRAMAIYRNAMSLIRSSIATR
jgi:flagellar basal-body rod protein FlgB